jgi:Na+-driven multidrug efflux pump
VALVFPGLMLMQIMSAGALGGGVASAVARALGGGRRAEADAVVLHALVIATGIAMFFTAAVLAGGPLLYAALGGRGESLSTALIYSNIVFAGVILIWLFNTLASVIRGTGNTFIPAVVTFAGAALLIPLSPCLILGIGPARMTPAARATADVLRFRCVVLRDYLWSAGGAARSVGDRAAGRVARIPRSARCRRWFR